MQSFFGQAQLGYHYIGTQLGQSPKEERKMQFIIGMGLGALAVVLIKQLSPDANIDVIGALIAGGALGILVIKEMRGKNSQTP